MLTRTRSVLLASGLLAIMITPFAIAGTGDNLREGVRNGTATRETQIVARVDASTSTTGGFSTRQSNLSSSGGGAVYGCRSGVAANDNACVRANNLAGGRAFSFNAQSGESAGVITAGAGGDTKRPFTTNATGTATGLNADEVDGQSAAQLKTRWALVSENGDIIAQSGGFTVLDRYVTNNNIYIAAGEDLTDNGLTASIAIQNGLDTSGDGTADPNFGGEVGVSRCQITGAVDCAPANSKTPNAFVVRTSNSDGTSTTGSAANPRKRFYVTITGNA